MLTPTYNRRDLLAKTLASVQAQTYDRVEHIVLDGGSTDGTVDLLRRAERAWGVRWVSAFDGGMYEALNAGLERATGEVVGWVNSDDWLLPWTLQTVVEEMRRHQEPVAVYGDVLSVELGACGAQVQVHAPFDRRALGAGVTIAQPTVFWPTAAGRAAGPLDTKTYMQLADCEYWLRLSRTLRFVRARELLAVVQDHPHTKRASLSEDVASEKERLRCTYGAAHGDAAVLVLEAFRRRWEWLAFLRGAGWSEALGSPLLDPAWKDESLLRRLGHIGPLASPPFTDAVVGITALQECYASVACELDHA